MDSAVQVFVKPFSDSIAIDMSKLVAKSASPLVKGKPESKLTNLVADILYDFGSEYCTANKLSISPDAAYVNYGGLRASLPQGDINVGHIFELMPFENEIVMIKISGKSMNQMASRIASRGGEGLSGVKLGIAEGKVKTLLIGGKTVDQESNYWLVTNDYIANGGDQMIMFLNPTERIDTKIKLRDLLIQSIKTRFEKNGILDIKEDGRIFYEQ
jgi:2',3'-cyclic-nucleotide 2'-phosphodiesterase (5'-nucleotidase family)